MFKCVTYISLCLLLTCHYTLNDETFIGIYCILCGQIKGTKFALFSIKCKGAVWKKSTVIKL